MNREGLAPAADPEAPYARLGVVGLIMRRDTRSGVAERTGGQDTWLLMRPAGAIESWDPPGGRLERFEDLAEGVRREVKEETGLSVLVAGPCYAYLTYHKGERLVAVSMACRVDPEGRDADDVRPEPDVAAWGWRTAVEWEDLARRGLSSWSAADVRRVTRLVKELWEAERP